MLTYYLLFVWLAGENGLPEEAVVRLRLPGGGGFACMSDLPRGRFRADVQAAANRALQDGRFMTAEFAAMEALSAYVSDEVNCCLNAALEKNLSCNQCDRIADYDNLLQSDLRRTYSGLSGYALSPAPGSEPAGCNFTIKA